MLQLRCSLPWTSQESNTITTQDINDIRAAGSLNEVSSIWAKIEDFFCGRHKEEAKEIIFKLMRGEGSYIGLGSQTDTGTLKLCERLRDITSEGFKQNVSFQSDFDTQCTNFTVKDSDGAEILNIDVRGLSVKDWEEYYQAQTKYESLDSHSRQAPVKKQNPEYHGRQAPTREQDPDYHAWLERNQAQNRKKLMLISTGSALRIKLILKSTEDSSMGIGNLDGILSNCHRIKG